MGLAAGGGSSRPGSSSFLIDTIGCGLPTHPRQLGNLRPGGWGRGAWGHLLGVDWFQFLQNLLGFPATLEAVAVVIP